MKDLNELIAALRRELDNEDKKNQFYNIIHQIAVFCSETFNVSDIEVAIFLSNKDKSVLSFAYPDYLVNSGMIPITSTEAVVAAVFRTGRSVIINSFSHQKHLSVFELIKTPNDEISPIWKMMGTLIAIGDDKIGVIEISRRGKSPYDVDEDFTAEQLEKLQMSIDKVAPFIKKSMPEDFKGHLR